MKLWRLAYRFRGAQTVLALGPYPIVTRAAARSARYEARRLIIAGQDPADRWVHSFSVRLWARMEADLLP